MLKNSIKRMDHRKKRLTIYFKIIVWYVKANFKIQHLIAIMLANLETLIFQLMAINVQISFKIISAQIKLIVKLIISHQIYFQLITKT